ncbi:MAG: hypothetical protein AVDCRST_MAG89-1391, partial [uncultured Gemmatimonadetes bacterium]
WRTCGTCRIVQVKPRTGRASGPCRGFPLSQRRVHPLRMGRGRDPIDTHTLPHSRTPALPHAEAPWRIRTPGLRSISA